MFQIQVNFSEHDKVFDSDELGTPRLRLAVSSVTASVNQNTWNLIVSASMNSVVITDYFATGGAEPRLLLAAVADSEQDNEGKFLSVQYMKVLSICFAWSLSCILIYVFLICLKDDYSTLIPFECYFHFI